ncbi:hypothetical protein [Lysobacter brunescens]|uniref:DUF3618 domain-containing protein n=1 Tax=Lysobacter brunescens TaxID=262323 RepID=A0ABW2Y7L6_9GAMM
MSTIDRLSERGTSLVTHARQALGSGASSLPKLLEAGAMLGVAKTGLRAATTLARRNPALAITLGVVGAGVLAYRFHRRRADAKAASTPMKLTVHRTADRDGDAGDAHADGKAAKKTPRKASGSRGATRAKSASRDE